MNTNLQKTRTWITIVVVTAILWLIVSLLRKHDEEMQQNAELYEACVQEEFGTTPSAWYETQGSYPVCES